MAMLIKDELWQQALGELQIQMRAEDFRTWFGNTRLLDYDGANCVVGVENPFNVDWLKTKCSGVVSRTLESLLGTEVAVSFVVDHPEPPAAEPPPPLDLHPPVGNQTRLGRLTDTAEPNVGSS